jgi:hypothetical protein
MTIVTIMFGKLGEIKFTCPKKPGWVGGEYRGNRRFPDAELI